MPDKKKKKKNKCKKKKCSNWKGGKCICYGQQTKHGDEQSYGGGFRWQF